MFHRKKSQNYDHIYNRSRNKFQTHIFVAIMPKILLIDLQVQLHIRTYIYIIQYDDVYSHSSGKKLNTFKG